MINEVSMVSRCELCPDRILNCKAILLRLEERRLWKPVRRVNLEGVRVLARLKVLTFRELYNDLFN